MIKFQVGYSLNNIKKVDVPENTDMRSRCINHFDTWNEAHEFIMKHAVKKITFATNSVTAADKHYNEMSQLKEEDCG